MTHFPRTAFFKILIACTIPVILAACQSSEPSANSEASGVATASTPAVAPAAPATPAAPTPAIAPDAPPPAASTPAPAHATAVAPIDPLAARLEAAEHEEIHVDPPVIPDRTFNLMDYGAVGDGKHFNTDAFKKAIAAIKAAGGGHLIVPEGKFLTKSFELTSHMDLHLDPGAIITASSNLADYGLGDPNKPSTRPTTRPPDMQIPVEPRSRGGTRPASRPQRGGFGEYGYYLNRIPALITANNVTDVSITGSGTIDGAGQMFWIWSDKAARKYPPGRTVVQRPHLISMRGIKRLHIDGVMLSNSPRSHAALTGSNMLIENVRIYSPSDSPNTDAFNPGGDHIVIRHCHIDNGDDDCAVQSGTHDILIENCTMLHGHGISIGSSTYDGVRHMIVRDCTFDSTDNGLRIKSYRRAGGDCADIIYTNITMINVRRPFDINMRYNGNANVSSDVGPKENVDDIDTYINFHDIHVNNLTVSGSPVAGRIIGLPDIPAEDFTFTNCHFQATRGFYLEDAKNIRFINSTVKPDIGEAFITRNATATIDGQPATGAGDSDPFYAGD